MSRESRSGTRGGKANRHRPNGNGLVPREKKRVFKMVSHPAAESKWPQPGRPQTACARDWPRSERGRNAVRFSRRRSHVSSCFLACFMTELFSEILEISKSLE